MFMIADWPHSRIRFPPFSTERAISGWKPDEGATLLGSTGRRPSKWRGLFLLCTFCSLIWPISIPLHLLYVLIGYCSIAHSRLPMITLNNIMQRLTFLPIKLSLVSRMSFPCFPSIPPFAPPLSLSLFFYTLLIQIAWRWFFFPLFSIQLARCNRQLASSELHHRPSDVTRSMVQKAVVVIASHPIFVRPLFAPYFYRPTPKETNFPHRAW